MASVGVRYTALHLLRRRVKGKELWWNNIQNGITLVDEYKNNFRMNKENFEQLCAALRPYIERSDSVMRNAISPETQVEATLYHLSDEGRLRKTASAFEIFLLLAENRNKGCLENSRDEAITPCCKQLEGNLQQLHIYRQAWHGGSFVGNHIHKMLEVYQTGQSFVWNIVVIKNVCFTTEIHLDCRFKETALHFGSNSICRLP